MSRSLTDFDALTFDCYGTLIDWESGIHTAAAQWLKAKGVTKDRDEILEAFAQAESAQEAETPALLYPALLALVLKRLANTWGLKASDAEAADFGASVPDWPAFADSRDSLDYLKQHYKLVILSNVDQESFQASNAKLGITFDAIYTAEDVGSYKPNPANFTYMLEHLKADLGIEKPQILHTAQSLFHDHKQAEAFGLATNWIDRRKGQEGGGATVIPEVMPRIDFHHASMADFVAAHRAAKS